MKKSALVALVGLAALYLPAHAETVLQKAQRDGTFAIPGEDPAMTAAFAKTQQTLDSFVNVLDNKPSGSSDYAIKLPIEDGDKTEYFWLIDLSHQGDQFTGTVDNDPETVTNVSNGQKLTFDRRDIRDWSYFQNGKMQGSFTTCVLMSREDPAEAKDFEGRIGLTCP